MNANYDTMYGCDPAAMLAHLAEPIAERGLAQVLNSILSDTQELLVCGNAEAARKRINCVKYVIDNQLPNNSRTPEELPCQSLSAG